MEYAVLILLWVCWCTIHSLLISRRVTSALQERLAGAFRYFRFAYNIFAIATLIPLVYYSRGMHGGVVLQWQGLPVIIQALLFLCSLLFFIGGAIKYDMSRFLGVAQIKSGESPATLTEDGRFDTGGILQVVRHPWYLGGIIFLWTYQSEIDLQSLLTNLILTCYLIVGAFLEENKLLAQFGEQYHRYRQQVSMFFPFKWLRTALRHLVSG